MIAPPWYELPPTGYGGIELICAALVDAFVARGHHVTLYGAGQHAVSATKFVSTFADPQFPRLGEALPEVLHTAQVNQLLADDHVDVVHDHSLTGPLTAAQRSAPTVVTMHGRVDSELGDYFAELGSGVSLVAISHAQRHRRPELPWAATVHNGVDPSRFMPGISSDGPVLWLGRFNPDKGPDLAIEACRRAGLPLILAGKCNEPNEVRYLAETIRPMLGSDVHLVVNGDRPTTNRLVSQARCLLMSIRWPEPFGMVMIEAMASGTPVVALRHGSVPEVVRDGVTGFICDHPAELPDALHRVDQLDPADCVACVRNAFSAELMASRYEQVYRRAMVTFNRNRVSRPKVALAARPVALRAARF